MILSLIITLIFFGPATIAVAAEFLPGVEGVNNVTWGKPYPDGYYEDGYPVEQEDEKS
jgi:hypothetical protein